jgi:hypothetical protein
MNKATAAKVILRTAKRLHNRLYRAAFLHAKDSMNLKPRLSPYWHRRLDELDKKLGFQ